MNTPPVVFIPGLASVIENFRETVVELTRNHTVYYLETREKKSAKINRKDRFHSHDEDTDIAGRISNSHCLDLTDNKRTHSAEMGRIISDFISSPEQIPSQANLPLRDIS